MTLRKSDAAQLQALNEQTRVAVVQAILKVIGPEYTVKILTGNLEIADLIPTGHNLSMKMSIDIYPRDVKTP